MHKHDRVLSWRSKLVKPLTAKRLAESLSCEGIRYEDIPPKMYKLVVAFRHLRYDERLRRAQAFLDKVTPNRRA